jgi:hypothetical protein
VLQGCCCSLAASSSHSWFATWSSASSTGPASSAARASGRSGPCGFGRCHSRDAGGGGRAGGGDGGGPWEEVVSRKRQASRSPPPPPPPVLADLNGLCFNCFSDSHFAARCPHPARCFRCHRLGLREEDCTLPRVLRWRPPGYVSVPPRPRGGGVWFAAASVTSGCPATAPVSASLGPAAAGFPLSAVAAASGFSPADAPDASGLSHASPAAGPSRSSSSPSSGWGPSRCCWVVPSPRQGASSYRCSAGPTS